MTEASETELKPGQWVPGMKSPNPAGRPKGIIDKRVKLQRVFTDNGEGLVQTVVDAALAGDMQALGMALARVVPPIKAQTERVQFDLDPDLPMSEQARQILIAVSEGKLDADTARILIGCIQSVAGIRAVEDLESRIITLEARDVT
jgi:hypothetical protein